VKWRTRDTEREGERERERERNLLDAGTDRPVLVINSKEHFNSFKHACKRISPDLVITETSVFCHRVCLGISYNS
jgi:hypothetical protein